ncbi:unnamed protein product, partial [Prorocentrum cordatum]
LAILPTSPPPVPPVPPSSRWRVCVLQAPQPRGGPNGRGVALIRLVPGPAPPRGGARPRPGAREHTGRTRGGIVGADRRGRPRGGQTAVRQPRGAAGGADLRGAGPGRGACARVRQPLQATPGQRDLPLASCAPATLRRRAELGQERPPEEGGGAGGGGGGPRH